MKCIYKITTPSGRIYVGQTVNFRRRMTEHRYLVKHKTSPLYSSIKKYGFDAHLFGIIHELPDDTTQSIIDEYEKYYISQFTDCGFSVMNLERGGTKGKVGVVKSPETRAKLSEKLKGRKFTEEHKLRIAQASIGHKRLLGRKFSDDHKRKIGDANRISLKGRIPWNKGLKTGVKNKQ